MIQNQSVVSFQSLNSANLLFQKDEENLKIRLLQIIWHKNKKTAQQSGLFV